MSAGGIQNKGIRFKIEQTREQRAALQSTGAAFKAAIDRTTQMGSSLVASVAPFVPGGAVVSAAVSSLSSGLGGQATAGVSGGPNALGLSGGAAVSGGAGGSAIGAVEANVASGAESSADQMLLATREMQEMNQSFNLQYLQLQQNMQQENRKFTTLSNVMKAKHDTAKNAINNVR